MKTVRCGSYPFMNIAEDFGLPYAIVLCYAEGCERMMFHEACHAGIWATAAADFIRKNMMEHRRSAFNAAVCKAVAVTWAMKYPDQTVAIA